MTTVVVEGTGYTAAVERLRDADHAAAGQTQALARELQGCGAMIGEPTLAGGLATAYDRAAARALDARATLTGTLVGLGAATAASLYNHTRAEIASYVGPTQHLDEPTDVAGTGARGWDEVDRPGSLPSSLGGTDLDLPGWAREVLDHVQGFVWPDADLAKLRAAAAAWHRAGHGLTLVGTDVLGAASALGSERSPEIPVAQDALRRLHTRLLDMADDQHQIGSVCTQYADLVAERRALILDLVREVKERAGSLLDTALDPGIEGLVFPALHAYRVGKAALSGLDALVQAAREAGPRFLGYLHDLRAGATDLARTLDGAASRLDTLDRDLFFANPSHQFGPHARGPDPWLRQHEGGTADGHTIRRHVGKTVTQLRQRMAKRPKMQYASSYPDEKTAGSAIRAALSANSRRIDAFLASDRVRMAPIHWTAPDTVGTVVPRIKSAHGTRDILIILVRDDTMPDGYRLLTSFPEGR